MLRDNHPRGDLMAGMFQSITFKVLGIGFLALLMLIPLGHVQGLIFERNGLREKALADIAQRWGAVQVLGGPVLAIPKRTRMSETSTMAGSCSKARKSCSPIGSTSVARWRRKSAATACTLLPCIQPN